MCVPLVVIASATVGYFASVTSGPTLSETVELFGENGGLVAFAATLAITPIMTVTGWRILRLRKWFGLLTFVYGSLDGLRFFVLNPPGSVLDEPFLIAGVLSLLLMVPLALTSNRWSIRRLGRRWPVLHRLTYVAALVLLLHIALIPGEPTEIIVPLALFVPSGVLRIPTVARWFRARRAAAVPK